MEIKDYINQANGEFRLHGIQREEMTVTPELAAEMLAHSTYNRVLKEKRTDCYKERMADGRWIQGFATIDFDWNGRLINGHHVLTTIKQCGIAQICEIRANMPPEAVDYYDQPESVRNIRDSLSFKLEGRWIADADKKTKIILKYHAWVFGSKPTNSERINYLLSNEQAVNSAYYRASAYNRQGMNSTNDFVAAGLHIVLTRGGCAAWHGFCDALLDSMEAGKNEPTNAFRRYAAAKMYNGKTTAGRTGRRDIFIAAILAFNCWTERRRICGLKSLDDAPLPDVSLMERR